MSERFQVIPAVYVLLRQGDQVLLQLRQNTGYMDGHWAVAAAGHIEVGESVTEAACRETTEELSITIRVEDLEPLCTMQRSQPVTGPTSERVDFFFQCTTWTGTPQVAEPDKAADIGWFDMTDLPRPMVAHEAALIEAVAANTLSAIESFGFGSDDTFGCG